MLKNVFLTYSFVEPLSLMPFKRALMMYLHFNYPTRSINPILFTLTRIIILPHRLDLLFSGFFSLLIFSLLEKSRTGKIAAFTFVNHIFHV